VAWVLVLLRLSRLVQFRVPWGIGGCRFDPVWDEMDSAHEQFDRNTSQRKKKVAASMVWWLVISFYQVPMALYPNEDGLLAPGTCVDGTYHDKVPGEPIGSSVPFKQCL